MGVEAFRFGVYTYVVGGNVIADVTDVVVANVAHKAACRSPEAVVTPLMPVVEVVLAPFTVTGKIACFVTHKPCLGKACHGLIVEVC